MEPHGGTGNQRMFAMLETMREEQENLNRELAAKEEEKARCEERTGQLLGKKENLEATLAVLRRQEGLLEEEVRHLKQELNSCNAKKTVRVEELEAHARILEKLEMTQAVLETRKGEIGENMRKSREAVIEAEGETKLGKLLELATRTRVKVEAEVAAKVAEHGSVEEIQEKIEKKRHEVQRQEEEHWHVEEENQLQLQVIQERRGIVSKLEIEARMRENKAQAQVLGRKEGRKVHLKYLRLTAFSIFCSLKRAEVAKASPNLKDKEVAIKLCRIWNQLGEEEQAPYFSAAAKYPQRERAEIGECLNEGLAVLGVKNRGDIEGLDVVNMEEEARGSEAGRRALACGGGEPVAAAGDPGAERDCEQVGDRGKDEGEQGPSSGEEVEDEEGRAACPEA